MRGLQAALLGMAVHAVLTAYVPSIATAHGNAPKEIERWGPLAPGPLHCLLTTATASQRCFHQALAIQRQCMDAQLMGRTCDPTSRDAALAALLDTAQQAVVGACTGGEITELGFNDLDEAKLDIARACTGQAEATASLLYNPAFNSDSPRRMGAAERQCLIGAGAYGQKLVDHIIRMKTRELNSMSVRLIGPNRKRKMLDGARARATSLSQQIGNLVRSRCPNFETIYPVDLPSLLGQIDLRGNCVIGFSYYQSAITCPIPVCGNAVKETGEECDDANLVDDDTCHNNCTLNH